MVKGHEIQAIREASDSYLSQMYGAHRKKVMYYISEHYNLDESRCSEVYQEAFFIFFEKVRTGSITHLTCSISTYLVGIAKNLAKDLSKSKWSNSVDKFGLSIGMEEQPLIDEQYRQTEELDESYQDLHLALSKMNENCKTVLNLYYYREFSMEAIAARMKYKNENVAKKSKYQCLQKLKSILKEIRENKDTSNE